jgi:HEAT repeat protein
LKGDRAEDALIQLRHNSDPEVRWAVAHGLGGTEHPDAIQALIELVEDTDDEVRNWSTFGLGQRYPYNHPDSPEIRDAFRKRLNDPFRDVRDEAVWALALRKDLQGLQLLIDRLFAEEYCQGDEATAEEILDVDLTGDVSVGQLRAGLQKLLGLPDAPHSP